ncbi:MAG: hypothetical protein Q8O62_11245 [Aequorivita sp.]|nr:hypothetical protein [Aequorivita sp.]
MNSKKINIKAAVQRLSWRLGNGKFQPNENDIDALNFIINWINTEKSEMIRDNILLAKCYTRLLMYETLYYKDVKQSSIQLNKALTELPIETFYDEFASRLNDLEYNSFLQSKGMTMKHPALKSDIDRAAEAKLIEDNYKEFEQYVLKGKWTSEQVYSSLNNQITELIKIQ